MPPGTAGARQPKPMVRDDEYNMFELATPGSQETKPGLKVPILGPPFIGAISGKR
jgi:hypothetical protein